MFVTALSKNKQAYCILKLFNIRIYSNSCSYGSFYSVWRGTVMHKVCSYHIAILPFVKMFHLQNRT